MQKNKCTKGHEGFVLDCPWCEIRRQAAMNDAKANEIERLRAALIFIVDRNDIENLSVLVEQARSASPQTGKQQ